MKSSSFTVEIPTDAAVKFADISGDWNPLHTDAQYAAVSTYKKTILHGAYSAGLISRLAGMELPGKECLLHGMNLRFIAPIYLPVTVVVQGGIVEETQNLGRAKASVSDAKTGKVYVEATYEFSRTTETLVKVPETPVSADNDSSSPIVLVTGATGGVGGALLRLLGSNGHGVSRTKANGMLHVSDLEHLADVIGDRKLSAIVHCAWPALDNCAFVKLSDPYSAIDYNVAAPLRQIQALSKVLQTNGVSGAHLVLVGSTAALPGRHNYRAPLYSLSKSMVPTLAQILSMELALYSKRCTAVVFDIVDGGMSSSMSPVAKVAHEDRSPFGLIPSPEEIAEQLHWLIKNPSPLVSGGTLTLSGGAVP